MRRNDPWQPVARLSTPIVVSKLKMGLISLQP
jgi:hypothetical protein